MRRFALLLALAAVSACSTAPGPQPIQTNQSVPSSPPASPAAPTPGSPQAATGAPKEPIDAKVAELKAKYEKNPQDAAVKKEYAQALFQNAEFYMYNSPLPPNQKYPRALALYRESLELDPTNSAAKQSIETIEGIYRSLGRPVPTV